MEKMTKILNTTYILWLRQFKRYLRSRSRIVTSIAQPLLFLVALGFGFGPIFQKAGGGNYLEFLAPGIVVMSVIFTAVFSGIEVISDRQFGFLKETMVAPVPRSAIMIGRTLGGATGAVIQGIVVFFISIFIGFRPEFVLLPLTFIFMILIAVLFTALGTAIASRMEDMQAFPLIMNFLVMPSFFLSGALFPLKGLPKILTFVAAINPLAYGVDGIRGTLLNRGAHFGLLADFTALSIITILILAIGSYLFSKIQI